MTVPTEDYTYSEEFIPVKDLEVDPAVQRQLNRNKVADLVKNWNPAATGIAHVSRRKSRANILLDGMHRREAAAIVTDNLGELWCRVFTGLTLPQEAQLFLDLNRTNAPSLMDKFHVLQTGASGDAVAAQEIQRIVGMYGWKVARTAGPGHINCVKVLQRIYDRSMAKERDPNILQLTIMVITDSWSTNDRTSVDGSLVEGIAAVLDEYGSNLDVARLKQVLQTTEGGAVGLLSRSQVMAKLRGGRRAMAVAYLIMEEYNKGLHKRSLGTWRAR